MCLHLPAELVSCSAFKIAALLSSHTSVDSTCSCPNSYSRFRRYITSQTSAHNATYSASQLLSVTIACSPLFQLTAPWLMKLMYPPWLLLVIASVAYDASTAPIRMPDVPRSCSSLELPHWMQKSLVATRYMITRFAASMTFLHGRTRCLLSTDTAYAASNLSAVVAYPIDPINDRIRLIISSVGSSAKSASVKENPGSMGVLYALVSVSPSS